MYSIILAVLFVQAIECAAFWVGPRGSQGFRGGVEPTRTCFRGVVTISTPSQAECKAMGVREWPQQIKRGIWEEQTAETEVVRYVLEGKGFVVVADPIDGTTNKQVIQSGTLVSVTGPAVLKWQASTKDMVILTPSYEQGGLLLAVGGGLVALLATLILATSS